MEINQGLVKKVKLHEENQPAEMARIETELEEIAPRTVNIQGENLVIDIENPKESETAKVDLETIKESLKKGVDEEFREIESEEESKVEVGETQGEQEREETKYKGERISFDFQDA